MILKIEIPENFNEHFGNDKFNDSLGRICYDIENAFKTGSGVSGRYEWEDEEDFAEEVKRVRNAGKPSDYSNRDSEESAYDAV